MAKKKSIKLNIRFKLGTNNRDIEIDKVSEINLSNTDREFFYLEKKDGTWILNYTKSKIPDVKELLGFEIIDANLLENI